MKPGTIRRICVFCGANPGTDPVYREAAENLGRVLARNGIGLVYGGASIGLMGALADAALAEGGEVIGVIPRSLASSERAHAGLSELKTVGTMHERKALMEKLSDGFIAMPGGFGTLDELCEIITWAQLGIHRKPVGILNVKGYWDGFLAFLGHAVAEGLILGKYRDFLATESDPEVLVRRLLG